MKYTYIGGVLKDGFYRRIHNSARGNKRAQKKALGSLHWKEQEFSKYGIVNYVCMTLHGAK